MYIRIFFIAIFLVCISKTAYAKSVFRPNTVHTVQAENAIEINGYLRKENRHLANVNSGDWFSIDSNDLGVGIDTITMRYAKGDRSIANLEVRSGSLTGPLLTSGPVPTTHGWGRYIYLSYPVENLKGENKLYFIFSGGGTIGNVDRIVFGRAQENVLYSGRAQQTHGVEASGWTQTNANEGDWVKFENVLMGNGFSEFAMQYMKMDDDHNNVSFHLNDLDGPKIGEIDISSSDGRRKIVTGDLQGVQGTHDIFARFSGPGEISYFDYLVLKSQPLSTKLYVAEANAYSGMTYFGDNRYLRIDQTRPYHWLKFDDTSISYSPKIELSYARHSDAPMRLEVRRNGINGHILGIINLPTTGSAVNYENIGMRLPNPQTGVYNLYFSFVGDGDLNIGDINLVRIEGDNINNPPLGELALDNIITDQFGYRPEMEKIAILRDGQVGLGQETDYIPGNDVSLIDNNTHESVFNSTTQIHSNGTTDPLSGDRTWSFDFSSIQTPGTYYVYDADNNARSATFDIIEDVYDDVLREAFKTFVYQRSGFTKTANIVGENYADDASHLGPLQDLGARLFNDQRNPSTSRDLSGGWYDAGDFKKYSNWTADYVLGLLHAYHANPDAWSDDWNLPDSGNGVPDILDEVRWGVEHLQRMQEIASETTSANAGSVLSVVDSDDSVTPPSSNEANSFYGPATTSATFTSAAAFAFASSTFANLSDQSFQTLASTLSESAISAYQWAEANPNIRFNNAEHGVGNGNSEVSSDYMLDAKHRIAAVYLYGLTGEARYKNYVESNYLNTNLMTIFWATPYEVEEPTALLHYTTLDGINPAIGSAIQTRFNNLMENAGNGRSAIGDDPYRAYVQEYAWGSNKAKSRKGHMYTQLNSYDLGDRSAQENLDAAAGYLHYIHGVNPLGKVYLTNMGAFGAERSVDEFYHRWFANDTQWDNVNTSFGPPPGYLVGGPNQFYNGSLDINQPPMKSYVETNAYLNGEASWQLTENSNGYQIEYLKLLSQFVD